MILVNNLGQYILRRFCEKKSISFCNCVLWNFHLIFRHRLKFLEVEARRIKPNKYALKSKNVVWILWKTWTEFLMSRTTLSSWDFQKLWTHATFFNLLLFMPEKLLCNDLQFVTLWINQHNYNCNGLNELLKVANMSYILWLSKLVLNFVFIVQ